MAAIIQSTDVIVLPAETLSPLAPQLHAVLTEALEGPFPSLTLDWSRVELVDTAILQVLIAARKSAEKLKKNLVFSPPSSSVAEVLKLTGLAGFLLAAGERL